jgi:cyanophycinase
MSFNSAKGVLIPIGGNEDKGEDENYTLDFIEEGILSHVVKESGGDNALIVVIPTASSIPEKVSENYISAFEKLGCTNIKILDIRSSVDSENPENLDLVKSANCVMFSGGNQSKITKAIGGTQMHTLLKSKYVNEKFVIAGTSAGAMAMSEDMIAGGSSVEALLKGAIKMSKGLGLISDLVIDSHFIRRGRFGRLAEAMAGLTKLIGIGLAEDTGLVIKHGKFRVIGSGMVIIFDPSKLKHNHYDILEEGVPMSMSNLTVHILANGDRFILEKRKIKILPLEEQFV